MATNPNDKAKAEKLIKRHEALKGQRAPWDSFCQDVARYVMPRKAQITNKDGVPSNNNEAQLFDNTAIMANQILANGKLSWMTPHESKWFSFDAPEEVSDNDDVKMWFKRCSEIAQAAIARSNFYSEIHELYLDRGAFGTACIYVEEGTKNPLQFTTFSMGSYALSEDAEKNADTCFREFKMNARQAAMKFGEDNLSEALKKKLHSKDPKEADVEHDFLHAVYPRDPDSYDPTKLDPTNMPIASCYVEIKEKHICHESGYNEQPFMATRYLKWGDSVYGWSPAWMALPDAKQVNFLEKNMDALAEISAFPRILVPDSLEGDIDLRAGGVTYTNGNGEPKEWITQGRYDVGLDRANRKRQAINDAFHVDLFRMFSNLEKQMTAREVAERASEKLIQFSPTFARMTTELFNPLLQRVFSIMLRSGKFPPPPQEVIMQDGSGGYLPEPKVSYSSRIALAISAQANGSFIRWVEAQQVLLSLRPDILDNLDLDKITRDMARNEGLPVDWIKPKQLVDEERAQRAAAAAQQQKLEQAALMADAAAKAGTIPAGSPVAQQLEAQAQ